MRDIPGWVGGALGVGALVGAFYLGGIVGATAPTSDVTDRVASADSTAAPASVTGDGIQVQCEPGQRAVVSTRSVDGLPAVSCVSEARPVDARAHGAALTTAAYGPAVSPVIETQPAAMARPAVLTGPTEVYRPRLRPTSYERREEAAPAKRTWERSAVIIGSSAAVGATLGGLTKGKKGALIGGIVGGGAATVWDQVTRRRTADASHR